MPVPQRVHPKSRKEYSRQDARDVKGFGRQVWEVAEHEDQQGLDWRDIVGETSHECWGKSKYDAKQDSTQPHNEEASKAGKDINGFNFFIPVHLGEGDEDVIQNLHVKIRRQQLLIFLNLAGLLISQMKQHVCV